MTFFFFFFYFTMWLLGSLFPDKELNPHPLHWKAKSLPLDY